MPSLPKHHVGTLYAGSVCLALAGVIALEARLFWQYPPSAGSTDAAPVAVPSIHAGKTIFPPLANFTEMTARPLFFAERRPPAEKASTQAAQELESPARYFSVSGIALTPGNTYAILEDRRSGDNLHVAAGSDVEGWTVSAIDHNGVTLEKDGETAALIPLQEPPSGLPPAVRHSGGH